MDERIRRRVWGLDKAIRARLKPSSRNGVSLVILGCQRSGTTMVVETLDRDPRVKTFAEYSSINVAAEGRRPWSIRSTSRYSIRMKPIPEVSTRLERARYPMIVLKPLVESQKAKAILDGIDRSACLWVFRHYRDVARSNVELFTPEVTEVNLGPIARRDPDDWRSEFVPEDVRELIARHHVPGMSPFDGGALFWYARNRLFFDLSLASDDRVMALRYEDLVAEPERWMERVYEHAGLPFPGPELTRDVHPRSVGLGRALELSPEIEAACEELWTQLNAARS